MMCSMCIVPHQPFAHLEDFLNNISVIVTNITGVHFSVVVAGGQSQLHLQHTRWQLQNAQFVCPSLTSEVS